MTERGNKWVMVVEVLLLLLPLTLFMALVIPLSYIAYPIPDPRPIQIGFDIGMLFSVAGVVAAWRLAVLYLRGGVRKLRQTSIVWLLAVVVAALIGLASSIIALEQLLFRAPPPQERVGFTLLAPLVVLLPVGLLLFSKRRQASG